MRGYLRRRGDRRGGEGNVLFVSFHDIMKKKAEDAGERGRGICLVVGSFGVAGIGCELGRGSVTAIQGPSRAAEQRGSPKPKQKARG